MPRYIAQCDLVLTAPNGSPDYVKQGEQRDFDEAPAKGRVVKWLPLDGEPEPEPEPEVEPSREPEPEVEPSRKPKKSPTDIDKPFTGVRALPADVIV